MIETPSVSVASKRYLGMVLFSLFLCMYVFILFSCQNTWHDVAVHLIDRSPRKVDLSCESQRSCRLTLDVLDLQRVGTGPSGVTRRKIDFGDLLSVLQRLWS